MKIMMTLAMTIFSLSSFANDCSDINNLGQRFDCVIDNNQALVNTISHSKPRRTMVEMLRDCSYKMNQASLKTSGSGCSYHSPCILLSLSGVPRAETSNDTYKNVIVEGFKLKFQPYRLTCE
ncbi:MAG: hypothetical protein CME65_03710 [Halobacteriovoraceae bacterium]|nr:hypothetical protein [Halobacteriovoraceae bacterium]